MTEQPVVSPELVAALNFQPECEIRRSGAKCADPAAWAIRLGHQCPGLPPLILACERHMTMIAEGSNHRQGIRCLACCWVTFVPRELYLSWTRL